MCSIPEKIFSHTHTQTERVSEWEIDTHALYVNTRRYNNSFVVFLSLPQISLMYVAGAVSLVILLFLSLLLSFLFIPTQAALNPALLPPSLSFSLPLFVFSHFAHVYAYAHQYIHAFYTCYVIANHQYVSWGLFRHLDTVLYECRAYVCKVWTIHSIGVTGTS